MPRSYSRLLPVALVAATILTALFGGFQCFAASRAKAAVKEAPLEPPKKPLSAYLTWLSESRPAIVKELGADTKPTEVMKAAGEQWRALAAAKKKPYETKAAQAKDAYAKALEEFTASGGVIVKKEKKEKTGKVKKEKAPKDPNAPKKPVGGGYGVYLAKHRAEIVKSLGEGHKPTEVTKEAAARWRELPEAKKKPYVGEYEKKKAAWDKYQASLADA